VFYTDAMKRINQLEDRLRRITQLVEMHKGGLLGGEVMPEDALVGTVPEDKLPDVITLGMSLNYQRNSYRLWEGVAETFTDPARKWVFDLAEASSATPEQLREALVAHKVALQPNKHTEIWGKIARTLDESGGTLQLILSHHSSIAELREYVQKSHKRDFPYLSGPKIFNYWLYVMESYCGVAWTDREEITIAPDTHILQASVRLGIVPESVLDGSAKSREFVAQTWKDLLHGSTLAPIDVHTPLWLWSRGGFMEVQPPIA
jgi:hypothetical protein